MTPRGTRPCALSTQETPGDWPGVMAMVRQIILEAEVETEHTIIDKVTIAA